MSEKVKLLRKPPGRPAKLVPDEKTLQTIHGLGMIQCTYRDCAAVLKVSAPTFQDFLQRYPVARETYDMGKDAGVASLRKTQFELARKSPAMAIFLGKNLLGQKDAVDHNLGNKDGEPLKTQNQTTVTLDLEAMTSEELIALRPVLLQLGRTADAGGEDRSDPDKPAESGGEGEV